MPKAAAANPSIIKTVDNPKTNDMETNAKEFVPELLGEFVFKLDTDDPAINARYGGTIGRTQGDKKLKIPATNEINTDIKNETSVSSWPNITLPSFQTILSTY